MFVTVLSKIKEKLKEEFKDDNKRLIHIYGVASMAKKLACKFKIDEDKAYIAGLCHDYYKNRSLEFLKSKIKSPEDLKKCEEVEALYHAYAIADSLEEEFGISDLEIYEAVKYHVFGKKGMNKLTEIVMISDYCELSRTYETCIKCRNILYINYDLAVYYSYYYVNSFLKRKGYHACLEQIQLEEEYKEKIEMNLLEVIVGSLEKVRATSINIYDVKLTNPLTDYLVVASVQTDRQAEGAVTYIKENALKNGFDVRQVEGKNGGWTLIDCRDVIVHVFSEDERCHYKLDSLYLDCPQVDINTLNTNIE